ncbi:hypothetical protein EAH84_11640 [Sphingomonas oligophenolica]|uniref:Lipoprotein n=2 Tax=Sphingomonas oligophenolica TaxID=301154 RepID=A0A502CCN5_9SPHN|nr:hypothetical protein [Sphingomonas oligophenolica]TPG10927.1 hypothetical protein EAH84_11640 [Sphingomonas oligophenolica]
MMRRWLPILLLPLATGGCVSTAASIVKAPFQVAGKAIDWTTTSQEESDRNYGRKMRKQEAKEGKARREAAKRCRQDPNDREACQYQGYRAGYGG